MRKCRVCGNPADEVVGSYNYASWLCTSHVDTFVMLATHWLYMDHQAVPYFDVIVPELYDDTVCVDLTGNSEENTKRAIVAVGWGDTKDTNGSEYSNALYDPEARGFARSRPKHLKVYPRWTGMDTHDADEKHGDVHTVEDGDDICRDTVKIDEKDYASKGIIWDSSTIYTKG